MKVSAFSGRSILKLIIGFGVFFVAAELIFRWIPVAPLLSEDYLVYDSLLGYRLRPGWSDDSGRIHVDSQGFRGKEQKNLDRKIIMAAIGGGDTFGRGVGHDGKAWPNRLDTLYRKHLPERNIKVINAGTPGYGLLSNLIDLEERVLSFNPYFALFMADLDHLKVASLPPPPPVGERWSFLASGIASALFPQKTARLERWPQKETGVLKRHLVSLVGLCRVHNVRPVFSTIPNTAQIIRLAQENDSGLKEFFVYLNPAAVLAAIRSYNEIIRRVAQRYNVYLVDGAERGKARLSPAQGLFLDDEGSLRVARGFLNATRSMGLHKNQQNLPAPGPRRGSIL